MHRKSFLATLGLLLIYSFVDIFLGYEYHDFCCQRSLHIAIYQAEGVEYKICDSSLIP